MTEEILYRFDETGRFTARTRTLLTGPQGETILGLEEETRGVYAITDLTNDRFTMTAQPGRDEASAQRAVIERLDADTLRDPGGTILRRVR